MNLADELQNRGFINQISSSTLSEIIEGEKRTIFQGIDPSANSAHIGNMVIWLLLRHLALADHKVIFLVGGGTGMIGDPKPDAERQLKDVATVEENVASIKVQAEQFFAGLDIEFVNNNDWLKDLKLIDFLRDVGKHYTVNELIKKDAIATRLQSDTGLSYTEFAYPLLQGYDYYQLNQTKNVTLQVGGSDQWGNIISGVELVRRKAQQEVFAITVPLVIDKATGKKFGKSEGNAVWLDPAQTSPYDFYQFWLNVSDESVIDHLKMFTFLPLADIEAIKVDFEANPGARSAQKILAYEVTKLVHGDELAEAVKNVSELLFSDKQLDTLTQTELEILLQNAPTSKLSSEVNIIDALVTAELATSKREARTFIEASAIMVNGQKVTDDTYMLTQDIALSGLILLKRGKKKLYIFQI